MSTSADILRTAAREIGTYEDPAGSNNVRYNTWYYGQPVSGSQYAWCMVFVQWVYAQSGSALPFRTASCGSLLRWYRDSQPECIVDKPVPGCIVIFDFPSTGSTTDHTGIFVRIEGDRIITIDGNTDEDHGGGVQQRQRKLSDCNPTYIVPRELREDHRAERYDNMTEIEASLPWAVPTIQKLIECGALTGKSGWYDGDGWPTGLDLSEDMIRAFVVSDRAGAYDN